MADENGLPVHPVVAAPAAVLTAELSLPCVPGDVPSLRAEDDTTESSPQAMRRLQSRLTKLKGAAAVIVANAKLTWTLDTCSTTRQVGRDATAGWRVGGRCALQGKQCFVGFLLTFLCFSPFLRPDALARRVDGLRKAKTTGPTDDAALEARFRKITGRDPTCMAGGLDFHSLPGSAPQPGSVGLSAADLVVDCSEDDLLALLDGDGTLNGDSQNNNSSSHTSYLQEMNGLFSEMSKLLAASGTAVADSKVQPDSKPTTGDETKAIDILMQKFGCTM
jgi:hypothetical protein